MPLGLTAAASAADTVIHKKVSGLGKATLTISSKETKDIMKLVKSLEDSGLLIKGNTQTTENETKE